MMHYTDAKANERSGVNASTTARCYPSSVGPTTPRRYHTKTECIRHGRSLRPRLLGPAERSVLVDQLYGIYRETVSGFTRDELDAQIFCADEGRAKLFFDTRGELVGFSYASIDRIETAGHRHAVFAAGVFFRLGYRGGKFAAAFGLGEAVLFKVRHPFTPLAYMTRSSSPAVYRLIASTMPRTYPSAGRKTPAQIRALIEAISARRKYVAVGASPWLVSTPATPLSAARMKQLECDPYVRFYLHLNPDYANGTALLTWVPLNMANICGGLLRVLWHFMKV